MAVTRILYKDYEVPVDLAYGRFFDQYNMNGFAQTSGSSTTTTALETSGAGSTPFDVVNVGDWLLYITPAGVFTWRRVTAKASSTSLTVNSAWDLTGGKALKIFPFKSGTADTDGSVFIGNWKHTTISYNLTTLGATTVRLVVQVRMSTSENWTNLFDVTIATTGSDAFVISEPWSFVRFGVEEASGSGTDVFNAVLQADDNIFA